MKIRSFHKLPLILSALCLPASLVSAATVLDLTRNSADQIRGQSQDTDAFPLGYFQNTTDETIGGAGGTGQRRYSNLVYGYTLPTLSAGQSIESFSFTFDVAEYRNDGGSDFDLDVYLLDASDPTGTGDALFYEGALDTSQDRIGSYTASATLPQTVIFTVNSGAALTTLQSFYTGGTPNQSEVYLRFNLGANAVALDDLDRYRVADITGSTDSFKMTVVPEPSSTLLGALGILALLRHRR